MQHKGAKRSEPKPRSLHRATVNLTDVTMERVRQYMAKEGISGLATAIRSLTHKALKAEGC